MNESIIHNPVIVAVGYNRPYALSRLLNSLSKASYPAKIHLIISIDKSDSEDVLRVAQSFLWNHGSKEILYSEKNLGCKRHITQCYELTEKFGSVIILEDDLYVSPHFYNYAVAALNYYHADENISGISLYSHAFNETALLPFTPIHDGTDVFFLPLPSSWGQLWTRNHWQNYQNWLKAHEKDRQKLDQLLPANVRAWPEASVWETDIIRYMIDQHKYFVYPRVSFSTNFACAGTHLPENIKLYQRPLEYGSRKMIFCRLEDSGAVYDTHCEIMSECLNRLAPILKEYDYDVDLYGMKKMEAFRKEYILTSKKSRSPIFSFGKEMKPHEANLIEGIEGNDIVLSRKTDVGATDGKLHFPKQSLFYYYELMEQHYRALQRDYIDSLDISNHLRVIEILGILFHTVKIRLLELVNKLIK